MLLWQTQKSYVVHYKFLRHILDGDASGFHIANKLINIHHLVIFLKIFLHVLISEASKYNMCKFYPIASNSLQVIHIVHKLFDCPSYSVKLKLQKNKYCYRHHLVPVQVGIEVVKVKLQLQWILQTLKWEKFYDRILH